MFTLAPLTDLTTDALRARAIRLSPRVHGPMQPDPVDVTCLRAVFAELDRRSGRAADVRAAA